MSAELLSSKLVVQEEEPTLRTITGVSTSTGYSVGITARGEIGVATLNNSFAEWQGRYGSDVVDGFAAQAVRGFFDNGGQALVFVRTVHYTDINTPATQTAVKGTLDLQTAAAAASAGFLDGTVVAPFNLAPGDTLDVDVDVGGPATATFLATAGAETSGNTETFVLVNGEPLTVKVDGEAVAQSIAFLTSEFVAIGAATAAEVAAVINAKIVGASCVPAAGAVVITSDQQGTGSAIEITGGAANVILGFPTVAVPGTGNVVDISEVSVAEVKTVVEAAVSGMTVSDILGVVRMETNAPGPAPLGIQVVATSTADVKLGLDNAVHNGGTGAAAPTLKVDGKDEGTYANNLTILISPATNAQATFFNLSVVDGGVVVETFPNLTMDDADLAYVEVVVNGTGGSILVEVTDLDVNPGSPLLERPADSPGATPVPFGPLTGGDDGLAALADTDFIGSDAGKTGLRAFDLFDEVGNIFVPDRPTPAVHNAMIQYAEVERSGSMFAVIDTPAGFDKVGVTTYVNATAGLKNLSEFGAFYWPQVKVVNPNKAIFGSDDSIVVPPSGHVAGMFARTAGARVGGVYDPPGGVEKGKLFGVVGLESDSVLEEAVRDFVAPELINPITKLRGQPIAVDDVQTLKAGGNFPTVGERLGVIFIEQSIKDGLQFVRIKNNDEDLRASADRTTDNFLLSQMRVSAFRTKNPATAFFVETDIPGVSINSPSQQFAGKLNQKIGLATQKPARFVVLSFSQDTRALDEELAAAG